MEFSNLTHKSTLDYESWKDKISNHIQLGGIETSILDNGAGKDVRIAWFDTGSGLRFKLVLDRSMDIAEAFYANHSLAWISHAGVTPPDRSASSGLNWLNGFGGGLLTTCGLTHIGATEKDSAEGRGLHDRISYMPAMVELISQPDLRDENPRMRITGRIFQSTVFGPQLELRRTISAKLGESKIKIEDKVSNIGNEPAPHMLLYHFNFGWPLIDEGTRIIWNGEWSSRGNSTDDEIFKNDNDFKICRGPMAEHNGSGESVAFIDITPDFSGMCECGVYNPELPLALKLRFKKEQLPWLTNWQHWGRNEYVTALEPGTHPPIGQFASREDDTLLYIQPKETRIYEVELIVSPDELKEIK